MLFSISDEKYKMIQFGAFVNFSLVVDVIILGDFSVVPKTAFARDVRISLAVFDLPCSETQFFFMRPPFFFAFERRHASISPIVPDGNENQSQSPDNRQNKYKKNYPGKIRHEKIINNLTGALKIKRC